MLGTLAFMTKGNQELIQKVDRFVLNIHHLQVELDAKTTVCNAHHPSYRWREIEKILKS